MLTRASGIWGRGGLLPPHSSVLTICLQEPLLTSGVGTEPWCPLSTQAHSSLDTIPPERPVEALGKCMSWGRRCSWACPPALSAPAALCTAV